MTNNDLLQRFASANPIDDEEAEDSLTTGQWQDMFDKIVSHHEPAPTKPNLRGQWRGLRLASLVVGAGLLAAGGYVLSRREVRDPGALGCSTQFNQLGDMTIIGRVEGETPIETCTRIMKETGAWTRAPVNPVECVTNYPNGDGGALVVFPAPEGMSQEEACQALGAALPLENSP